MAKRDKAAAALARRHTQAAVDALLLVLDPKRVTRDQDRIEAARELLDRGWGKPQQQHDVAVAGSLVVKWQKREK